MMNIPLQIDLHQPSPEKGSSEPLLTIKFYEWLRAVVEVGGSG